MPLSEELLLPIPGENPSGKNLKYDGIFEQLKEASFEEDEEIPEGDWERSKKKRADHRLVIKLASEALIKQSKDLQLAAYLTASIIQVEGFSSLAPSIDLLRQLQEQFWPTLYPEIEEGDDFYMRSIWVEKAAKSIGQALGKVPLTANKLSYNDYLESRRVGYEKDATSESKREARQDALAQGKLPAEEFDKAFQGSPKKLYLEGEAALADALAAIDRLDTYQREAYKDNEPNLRELRTIVEQVHQVVESLLNERRKTEPDPVTAPEGGQETASEGAEGEASAGGTGSVSVLRQGIPVRRARTAGEPLASVEDACELVVDSALYLFEQDQSSPVPYLICAGLRMGETAMQAADPAPGFAVGPSAEVRVLLRGLASAGSWTEVLRQAYPLLACDSARVWLDLHRYVWQAAQATGATALSDVVIGTVKSLLTVRPELRNWTLEDDTGAANPETQRWLDEFCRP